MPNSFIVLFSQRLDVLSLAVSFTLQLLDSEIDAHAPQVADACKQAKVMAKDDHFDAILLEERAGALQKRFVDSTQFSAWLSFLALSLNIHYTVFAPLQL